VKKAIDSKSKKRTFILISLVWLSYGIIMEFVQQRFIPNRSFDVGDIAADAIGCLLGYWFSSSRYIKK
jgi:VanZ family protein